VQDALGLGAGKVDTAYTAMNSAIDVVDQIKEKVLLAKTSSTDDRAKIQTEIASLQSQLKDNIGGANYAGSNLLKTTGSDSLTVMTSYNRDSTGAVTTGTIDVANTKTRLIDSASGGNTGLLDKTYGSAAASLLEFKVSGTGAVATGTAFDNMLTGIESALKDMATGAAELGAAKARIDMQKDFISKLSDSIDRGVGQLVDADMNKESTRLQALQVQQQLGIQSLSIANSNTQSILSLFRG
jgi:flagellin